MSGMSAGGFAVLSGAAPQDADSRVRIAAAARDGARRLLEPRMSGVVVAVCIAQAVGADCRTLGRMAERRCRPCGHSVCRMRVVVQNVPASAVFMAVRGPAGAAQVTLVDGADAVALPMRLDLRRHSPDGFEWGYGGSGPSQLALAMLAAATTDQLALEAYRDFVVACVARAKLPRWVLPVSDVRAWAQASQTHPLDVRPVA